MIKWLEKISKAMNKGVKDGLKSEIDHIRKRPEYSMKHNLNIDLSGIPKENIKIPRKKLNTSLDGKVTYRYLSELKLEKLAKGYVIDIHVNNQRISLKRKKNVNSVHSKNPKQAEKSV